MRARKTERFQARLDELTEHVEDQGFEVRGGFYTWDCLKVLVDRLRQAYDYFELEGDVGPARQAIEAYYQALADKGLRPDRWVAARLAQLLAELEAPEPKVELTVTLVPRPTPEAWPGVLAVHPEALEALLRLRKKKRHVTGS